MLIILLMLACVTDAKYIIPVAFTATGLTTTLDITPTVELRIGSGPGKNIQLHAIDTYTTAKTTLPVASCEYSSHCIQESDTVYNDVAYASDTQFNLTYTLADDTPTLALFPGSSIWGVNQNIALCPYERGLLVGYNVDTRCFKDMGIRRNAHVCGVTPFRCLFTATYNNAQVSVRLRIDDAHIRIASNLAICTACTLVMKDLILNIGAASTITVNKLTRLLIVVDDTLADNTITFGLATNAYAFTWTAAHSQLYINTAWNASGTLTIVDFIICAMALYALKIWLSWFDLSKEDSGSTVYRAMLIVEMLISTIGVIVICLYVFKYEFGDRIYRITDHISYDLSQILAYVIAAIATLFHYPAHLITIYQAWVLRESFCDTRKYCFELNMLLTISVVIVKTRAVSFLNVTSAAVGVAMLYGRDVGAYKTEFPAFSLFTFIPICIFVVGVLFAPIFQSISGFVGNTLLGSIYAATIIIMTPSMIK
jgi:hypothetical protein